MITLPMLELGLLLMNNIYNHKRKLNQEKGEGLVRVLKTLIDNLEKKNKKEKDYSALSIVCCL